MHSLSPAPSPLFLFCDFVKNHKNREERKREKEGGLLDLVRNKKKPSLLLESSHTHTHTGASTTSKHDRGFFSTSKVVQKTSSTYFLYLRCSKRGRGPPSLPTYLPSFLPPSLLHTPPQHTKTKGKGRLRSRGWMDGWMRQDICHRRPRKEGGGEKSGTVRPQIL